MTQTVKLLDKKEVATGTIAFVLERPAGFDYKAGQTIDVNLPSSVKNLENSHTFSLASAPYEKNLFFTTRMRDSVFKNALKQLKAGTKIEIEGPFGSFTLPNRSDRPIVILCGGIGVTPFFSMAKQADHDKLPHKIYLFFSNRRPQDAAFLNDLQKLEKSNPNFKLVTTMTKLEKTDRRTGERGYINFAMIKKYVSNLKDAIYYIAGPAEMIIGLKEMLNSVGIDDDDIRFEEFPGY